MPIGLVTDEDMEREISSYNRKSVPSVQSEVRVEILDRPGRDTGDNNVPESLRKIIGETSVIDGRQEALRLAEQFGISSSSVSAYARGATSTTTYQTPNKELKAHINKSRDRAIKRASKVLNGAIGAITQEKLDYTDAKDLASIAKDMTVVIKNLEPPVASQQSEDSTRAPQFVIFAPTFRQETSFETITVNE